MVGLTLNGSFRWTYNKIGFSNLHNQTKSQKSFHILSSYSLIPRIEKPSIVPWQQIITNLIYISVTGSVIN